MWPEPLRRRSRARAVLAALALALVPAGCGGHARRPPIFGFNDSAGPWSYALQASIGAPVRRIFVGWNEVEPQPSRWEWGPTDALYTALLEHHLRPLIVVSAAPCWSHPSLPCRAAAPGIAPPDPQFDAAWVQFVGRLAQRYPRAVAVEIWNEENLTRQFLPAPSPARYTRLLELAYRTVKEVDGRIPVISGGLFASAVSNSGVMADERFLTGMYAAGAKRFLDGIAVHPYPVAGGEDGTEAHYDVAATERTLARIRAARARAADTQAPLWVTEVGLSTAAYPGSPTPVSPQVQARDLLSIIGTLRRDGDVRAVIIQRLIDRSQPPGGALPGREPGYGVLWADGRPKPAACRLSAALHGTLRC